MICVIITTKGLFDPTPTALNARFGCDGVGKNLRELVRPVVQQTIKVDTFFYERTIRAELNLTLIEIKNASILEMRV